MTWLAGVDGISGGWCVVLNNVSTGRFIVREVSNFSDLLTCPEEPQIVCVDIPIGALHQTSCGGRTCEIETRKRIGPRRSSVFSTMSRFAWNETKLADANILLASKGCTRTSKQGLAILPKIKEIDGLMNPELQDRVREVHPELCFAVMAGHVLAYGKKSGDGKALRRTLLKSAGFADSFVDQGAKGLSQTNTDDFLDAMAGLWTARRILKGEAERLPGIIERDELGLDMAIWV